MDLSRRYEEILLKSRIAYPGLVKGTLFICPKGWAIWESIRKFLDIEYRKLGIKNVAFPSLIPLEELEKEKEKLSGFNPELFFVSRKNDGRGASLFLRPTSEILFSHYFRKTLQSHHQLPMKLNQWCNVYRSEKNTKAFVRMCEFYWQEAHTLHISREDAFECLNKFHEVYKKLCGELLCMAVLEGEKTLNERFPGAEVTLSLESVMPDGQAIQVGTSHYLSTYFSEIFDVKYSDRNNILQYPCQLSAGASVRLIGALIMGHSDDSGLVLPFWVSDVQVRVLVMNNVVREGDDVYSLISEGLKNYSVEWDWNDKRSFGFRIKEAEVEGVPVVVIIGEKEMKAGCVAVKTRLFPDKKQITIEQLGDYMRGAEQEYSLELKRRSKDKLRELVVDMKGGSSLEQVKKEVLEHGKIVLVPWWNDEGNEEAFRGEGFGFGARCIESKIEEGIDVKCFYSGRRANSYVYFGRSY